MDFPNVGQSNCWMCSGEGDFVICKECGNRACKECLGLRGTEPPENLYKPECGTCWGITEKE